MVVNPPFGEPITNSARLYAVRELFRRAGVSIQQYESWAVVIEDDWTSVYVQPGTRKRVRFRNDSTAVLGETRLDFNSVFKAEWMAPPPALVRARVPNFFVPFIIRATRAERQLFRPVQADCVDCDLDLPLSALLTLSRFEESRSTVRDAHGRFPSSASLAFRHGYLKRPVVDEYGLALEQALRFLLSAWTPATRKLRVKLSHDLDFVGIPFTLRETLGHAFVRHQPPAMIRDLLACLGDGSPTYLMQVQKLSEMSISRGLDSAFYWKASSPGDFDSGYDPRHSKVRRMIAWLSDHGIENGVHPGYNTYQSRDQLQSEVRVLREILGDQPMGGRQHYLRWSPATWLDWEACGLHYDSTVGFADCLGFRAGTCIPYRPWIFSEDRESHLIEIPLIAMDCTPIVYMGLTPDQSLCAIDDCIQACRAVGGVFTLLWHNTTLMDPSYGNLYRDVLDRLGDCEKFDWQNDMAIA